MAHEFRCRDAGAACRGKLRADSEEELERQVADHLRRKHDVHTVSRTLRNYLRSVTRKTDER